MQHLELQIQLCRSCWSVNAGYNVTINNRRCSSLLIGFRPALSKTKFRLHHHALMAWKWVRPLKSSGLGQNCHMTKKLQHFVDRSTHILLIQWVSTSSGRWQKYCYWQNLSQEDVSLEQGELSALGEKLRLRLRFSSYDSIVGESKQMANLAVKGLETAATGQST